MSEFHYEEEEFSSQFNGDTFMRILGQVKSHRLAIAGFMIAIGTVSAIEAYFTFLGKRIIDEAIVPNDLDKLTQIAIQYAGLYILLAGLVFSFIFLAGGLGQKVRYELRQKIFNHLQTLSFSYFDKTPVGWIMSRVTSDTERMAELVTWGMLDITWSIMHFITALIFMFAINWQLTLIVIVLIPILLVIAVKFKTRILVEYRKVRKLNSKITGTYNENITGVRVVKALVREDENLGEFDVLATDMYEFAYRAAWLSALFLPVVQFISAIAVGAVVVIGGFQVNEGGMSIGGIQAFIAYITFMLWPVQELARVYAEMQQAVASAERFFSLMDAKPDILDRPGAVDPGTIYADIEFDHVDFFYEEDKPVLTDFNLIVKKGEIHCPRGSDGWWQVHHSQSAQSLL